MNKNYLNKQSSLSMKSEGYYSSKTTGAGKEDTAVAATAATPAFLIKSRLLNFFLICPPDYYEYIYMKNPTPY